VAEQKNACLFFWRTESRGALSLPPEQIWSERLLAVARALTDREVESEPTAALLERLRHVQRETAASANLANLLA
jgi:hypothetical protein